MIKQTKAGYRQILSGDPDFTFSPDGITVIPRASLHISQRCPDNYKLLLIECIQHGWIKPVAHMRHSEYTWEKLQS